MDSFYLAMAYAVASLATWPRGGSQYGAVLGTGLFVANSRHVDFGPAESFYLTPEEVLSRMLQDTTTPYSLIHLVMPITRRVIANLCYMAIETVVLHRNYQQIISEFHPELTDVPNSVQTLAKHGITVREVSGSILAPEITLADGRWDPRLLTWRSSNHA